VTTPAFVPELEIVSLPSEERLLPDAAEGAVEVWAGNGIDAYGYTAAGHEWIHLPGVATFRFSTTPAKVVAIPDAGRSTDGVRDAYLRNILPLVLQMCGTEVLHASAVMTERGVIAICGVSGAGKSTLAHGLSQRGYDVIADDALALRIEGATVTVLRVPFWLKLRSDTSRSYPVATPEATPTSARGELPLRAVLVLNALDEIGPPSIRLERLASSAAFTALLAHAYYYRLSDIERKQQLVDRYLQLASSVEIVAARIRHDYDAFPTVLDSIEERVLGEVR
jgi:hypothetical protein